MVNTEFNWAYEVTRLSVEGCSKQVSYWMRKLGKKVSERWVRMQGVIQEDRCECFLIPFLIWITAIFHANYAGFELLWTHLQIYVGDLERERVGKANILSFPNKSAADGFIIAEIVKLKRSLELIAMRMEAAR